jgi:hypothetical protein
MPFHIIVKPIATRSNVPYSMTEEAANSKKRPNNAIVKQDVVLASYDSNLDGLQGADKESLLGRLCIPNDITPAQRLLNLGDATFIKQNLWSYGITKDELSILLTAESGMTISLMHTHLVMLQVAICD